MPSGIYKHKSMYILDKIRLYEEYIDNKKSTLRIAKEIGINPTTICRRLIEYNIPRRGVGQFKKDIRIKFYSKIKILPNRCWEWQGKINKSTGYGYFDTIGHAHRASYELHKGKIPKGMVINQLCGNKKCVNPEHLEMITLKEDRRRGNCPTGINYRKTHCIRNHPFSGSNLYIAPSGKRICRICRKMRLAHYLAKNRRTLRRRFFFGSYTNVSA